MNVQVGAAEAEAGRTVNEIDTPALLVDATSLEANIATMAALCAHRRQKLRPHAKTHKSPLITRLQQNKGSIGVCCAKLGEAEVLAHGGVQDVLITTPLCGLLKLRRLSTLARQIKVTTVIDNERAIEHLAAAASEAGVVLDVLVEVDVGQHRCGVIPGSAAARLAKAITSHSVLNFIGLQGYQGSMQSIIDYDERRAAVESALLCLQETAEHVQRAGHTVAVMTGGGSGSAAIDLALDGLSELQPGSYVFMDANYLRIRWDAAGNPPPFAPALSILGSVVSTPATDRVIVDVGWKSASSDAGPPVPKSRPDLVFEFAGDEHGTVRRRDGGTIDLRLGDRLELLPSHCDTTVNLYDKYTVLRLGLVESIWPVAARGCSR